jgi:hypothetical protein
VRLSGRDHRHHAAGLREAEARRVLGAARAPQTLC